MDDLEATLDAMMAARLAETGDGSHDIGHIRRVSASAQAIAAVEGGDRELLLAAAYLHDFVNTPKDAPDRALASQRSADAAEAILADLPFPVEKIPGVAHAILAHSVSAGHPPKTLEARILQDADRLDALGAIGIARTFCTAGQLGSRLFDPDDPMAAHRPLDDLRFALDHFEVKLFRLADGLHTETARGLAAERVALMQRFRQALLSESGRLGPETR